MSALNSLEKLITEGRNLRDFFLRIEGLDSNDLTRALAPFDGNTNPDNPPQDQVELLYTAFQEAFDQAQGTVDDRTLYDILEGRSPHLKKEGFWNKVRVVGSNTALALVAFLLVVTAFHYSYWASNTVTTLADARKFIEFNHFDNMSRLVELENYYEENNDSADTVDLEPQLIYLKEFAELESHYNAESVLPAEMHTLIHSFNPLKNFAQRTGLYICDSTQPEVATDQSFLRAVILKCIPPSAPIIQDKSGLPSPLLALFDRFDQETADAGMEVKPGIFRQTLLEVDQIQTTTMREAGRIPLNSYLQTRDHVNSRMQVLTGQLNIVYTWALPIVYGALGSIVFSIWCVLNPNVSSLGLYYTLIRTIFAGLAALTFSMIFIPSNVLAVGGDLSKPMIYLLSFIFGYSIEAFVNTLNLLNTYFASNIAARKKQQQ